MNLIRACYHPLVFLRREGVCSKGVVLTGLFAAAIVVAGCGSDGETPEDRSGGNDAAREDRGNEPTNSDSTAVEEATTESEGQLQRTGQGAQGSGEATSEKRKDERVARLIERMREAESQEPREELGCERYRFAGEEEPIYSIGPPPPQIEVSRVRAGALVSYRFSSLPDNETCRPFGLYVTVSGADVPNRSPTFENRSEELQLRGLSGKRVIEFPLAGEPPYEVSVASVSITGRSGPRVTAPVR